MYHPTTILETGWDIIFFWVARMILMSQYILGEVPFKTVYLHGIVRNSKGEKISKSLGNNIEPLELIAKYGADAVRMALIVNVGPGNDSKIGEEKIKAYKLFSNKIWNITRFILTSVENVSGFTYDPKFKAYVADDAELLKEFGVLLADITGDMDNHRYYLVADKLYQYAWTRFADVILEESKKVFASSDDATKISRAQALLTILTNLLKVLHPFMPYITEEIWTHMPTRVSDTKTLDQGLLMVEEWPKV